MSSYIPLQTTDKRLEDNKSKKKSFGKWNMSNYQGRSNSNPFVLQKFTARSNETNRFYICFEIDVMNKIFTPNQQNLV